MRLAGFILATGMALGAFTGDLRAAELFADGPGSSDFAIFPGWQRVMSQTAKDIAAAKPAPANFTPAKPEPAKAVCAAGQDCPMERWNAFIEETRKLPKDQQLEAVNKWANARPYAEDWANWGLPDYWETPKEFLTRGGDCEDYAIVKYYTLARLGFSPDDLRIVVVNDTNLEMFHAVLAVRKQGAPTVLLDNQMPQVVPMALMSHYRPFYSLNEKGWWMADEPQIALNIAPRRDEIFAAAGR